MANFRLAFTAGATVQPWIDPALGSVPTRIQPTPEHEHARYVAQVGNEVELTMTWDGIVAPTDAQLGAQVFDAQFAEVPQLPAPALSSPPGQSSIIRFTPPLAGHYTLRVYQLAMGGSIIVHVDAQ